MCDFRPSQPVNPYRGQISSGQGCEEFPELYIVETFFDEY